MGFQVSQKQRWEWLLCRLEEKIKRWNGMQLSFAGAMVLNHFVTPATIFYLTCWRPANSALKQLEGLCQRFMWSGNSHIKKWHKVKWEVCTQPKHMGGLGIHNLLRLADKMAGKWVLKSCLEPQQDWAQIINRNLPKFALDAAPKWQNLPLITVFYSKNRIRAKGSQLVRSLWMAWNNIKQRLEVNHSSKAADLMEGDDSIW